MATTEDPPPSDQDKPADHNTEGTTKSSSAFGGRPIKSWHAPHRDDMSPAPPSPTLPEPETPKATCSTPETTRVLPTKPATLPPPAAAAPVEAPGQPTATNQDNSFAPPTDAPPPKPVGHTPAQRHRAASQLPPMPETLAPTSPQPATPAPAAPQAPTTPHPSAHNQRPAPLLHTPATPAPPPAPAPAPTSPPQALTPQAPPVTPRAAAHQGQPFSPVDLAPAQNLTPSTSTSHHFTALNSLSFGFKTFNRYAKAFLILGILHIFFLLLPSAAELVAQVLFSALGAESDLRGFWLVLSVTLYLFCQAAVFFIVVATFHAAHQACQGICPTVKSAFTKLPWASPLLCTVIATVAFLVVTALTQFVALVITSPSEETVSAIIEGIHYALYFDDEEALLEWVKYAFAVAGYTAGWMAFAGSITGFFFALCSLYLLPATTSGSDIGLAGLVRSPALVAQRFGSSTLLLLLCSALLVIGLAACALPLYLWLLPVCATATTHAYRQVRGLPSSAQPSSFSSTPLPGSYRTHPSST